MSYPACQTDNLAHTLTSTWYMGVNQALMTPAVGMIRSSRKQHILEEKVNPLERIQSESNQIGLIDLGCV